MEEETATHLRELRGLLDGSAGGRPVLSSLLCGLGDSLECGENARVRELAGDAAEDGDVLRLQYLTTPLDLSLLQVESPFGQQILAYIDEQRATTAR